MKFKSGWHNYDCDWCGSIHIGRLAIGLTLRDWRWWHFRPKLTMIYWSERRLEQFRQDVFGAICQAIERKINAKA